MKTFKRLLPFLVIVIIILSAVSSAHAQCAMCQAVPQSSENAGSTAADGLNKGIMYILFMPYILIATIGFFWWKNRKKEEKPQPLQ